MLNPDMKLILSKIGSLEVLPDSNHKEMRKCGSWHYLKFVYVVLLIKI